MTVSRKLYYACLGIFVTGSFSRVALKYYLRSVSPHVSEAASGHTHALAFDRGIVVYVRAIEAHLLDSLYVLPYVFLVAGMVVWANAWREWK